MARCSVAAGRVMRFTRRAVAWLNGTLSLDLSSDEETARLYLRLAPAGFWGGRAVRHAGRARMGERRVGGHARRIDERPIEPAARPNR